MFVCIDVNIRIHKYVNSGQLRLQITVAGIELSIANT